MKQITRFICLLVLAAIASSVFIIPASTATRAIDHSRRSVSYANTSAQYDDPYSEFRSAKYSNAGLLSERDEVKLGTQLHREVTKKFNLTDVGLDRVERIGQRCARVSQRPNLTYRVLGKDSSYKQLLSFVKARPGDSGIVYCQSRNSAENVASRLNADGIRAEPYHAGLDAKAHALRHAGLLHGHDLLPASGASCVPRRTPRGGEVLARRGRRASA